MADEQGEEDLASDDVAVTVIDAGDAGDASASASAADGVGESASDVAVPVDERLLGILESVLFAAGEPLSLARLADVVPGPSRAELRAALVDLTGRLERERRGIRLVEVANGYQFRTDPAYAEWVRRLFQQKPWRLTRATLETLAIVAYKQPITRAEIEAIRGVDVDGVLASLLSRKLVKIVGRKDVIGRPLLYGTTRQFLEVFGLRDLSSLPALAEVAAAAPEAVGAGAAASDTMWSGDDSATEDDGDPATKMVGGRGNLLATGGGGTDSAGEGEAERPNGNGARDPGDSA
jgi:segregation and condensation protein B